MTTHHIIHTPTHTQTTTKKSHMPSMSEDLPPTLPDANAPPCTNPSSILLDKNAGPPPGQTQTLPQLTSNIKTMRLRLPHPCRLDVLPSPPINGAQPLTRSKVKSLALSIIHFHTNTSISNFHQGRVLHTKAFAISTTAMTIGDVGKPKGSTELDDVTGHNCSITKEE